MTALYLVLPLALVIATGAVLAFVWSVRSGQLDDLDTPPCRLLLEDGNLAGIAPLAQPGALGASSLTEPTQSPAAARASDWHDS